MAIPLPRCSGLASDSSNPQRPGLDLDLELLPQVEACLLEPEAAEADVGDALAGAPSAADGQQAVAAVAGFSSPPPLVPVVRVAHRRKAYR